MFTIASDGGQRAGDLRDGKSGECRTAPGSGTAVEVIRLMVRLLINGDRAVLKQGGALS